MRALYHLIAGEAPVPSELRPQGREEFVHLSYRDAVRESARLYFKGEVRVLQIDPRKLDAGLVRDDPTPRGPMPHAYGVIPASAIMRSLALDEIDSADDEI